MARDRIISGEVVDEGENKFNLALRPETLQDYIGQPRLVEKLSITLQAVQARNEPMEHVLLQGPPGLGKTTLAHIIASELGTQLTVTAGPALTRPSDLVGVLTKLQHRDVLFIDEIHRLSPMVEEYIYPAMEDFKIDVPIDTGMNAKVINIPLKPFSLIGATTRAGMLSGPLRSRFGMHHHFEFYAPESLQLILTHNAGRLGVTFEADALAELARRSRGTPRIANRLLRRTRDFAQVRADGKLTREVVAQALTLEGIDERGLDDLDRQYLRIIADIYRGGPVGLEAVAATMNEDAGTLEEMVEPYLLQIGFLARTRRGRMLTDASARHLGVSPPTPVEPAPEPEPDDADDSLF